MLLNETLKESQAENQPGGEIEARLHLADLQRALSGAGASEIYYQQALERVRLVANEALERKITIALADVLLELGDQDRAAGLLALASDGVSTRELELARAKLYWPRGQRTEAAAALKVAKTISYERWSADDEARLRSYTGNEI